MSSGLPLKTDIARHNRYFAFVPNRDIERAVAQTVGLQLQAAFQLAKALPDLMLQDMAPAVADRMS